MTPSNQKNSEVCLRLEQNLTPEEANVVPRVLQEALTIYINRHADDPQALVALKLRGSVVDIIQPFP